MSALFAHVYRDATVKTIEAHQLVPGDVIVLEAGNAVPADLRILEAHLVTVDESALTGESVPVLKNADKLDEDNVLIGDRFNMLYKGTLLTGGRAEAIVVGTAINTELGNIAKLMDDDPVETPIKKRMRIFGRQLSILIVLICSIIFTAGWLKGAKI